MIMVGLINPLRVLGTEKNFFHYTEGVSICVRASEMYLFDYSHTQNMEIGQCGLVAVK